MALTLEQIRARLKEKEQGTQNRGGRGGDNASYAFWDLPEGKPAAIRFLPDGDPNADFFWQERIVINLTFPYVLGATDAKPVKIAVPCLDMWPDLKGKDPILAETKKWWDDPELVELARKYWKKKSYVFQGFVTENPLSDDKTPENPIRRFIINSTIFKNIESVLTDPDVENLPTDYENGREFRIIRTKRGQYSDYTTSKWASKERPLTDEQRAAIDKFGLFKLTDFLPTKPTEDHINAIREMFHASVNEEAYDPARWGQFYKPFGVAVEQVNVSAPKPAARPAPAPAPVAAPSVDDEEEAPWQKPAVTEAAEPVSVQAKPAGGKDDAKAILDMIRKRQQGS